MELPDEPWLDDSESEEDRLEAERAEAEAAAEPVVDEAEVEAAFEAAEGADPSQPDYLYRQAALKVRKFPRTPGVYLFKDSVGRVIYVGKAKTLRSRAG